MAGVLARRAALAAKNAPERKIENDPRFHHRNGDAAEFVCDPTKRCWTRCATPRPDGCQGRCGTGDCGACSVTLDGRLVCSCLVLGAEAEGATIETIEGMAAADVLHPLQQSFIEHAALQCGVCTPGILVAAKALLSRNPDPTDTEVRYWLAGNLCRCTGYDKIIHAVQEAAKQMRNA